MKIVIAGGTGFLGRSLADALVREPATLQHDVIILTRQRVSSGHPSQPRLLTWAPNGAAGPWAAELDGASAVVNLAGESIGGRRWSDAQKQRILDSRRLATRSLVSAIRQATRPPLVFVSGSAVGYYGPRGDEIVTEDAPAGSDFLARVCLQWEEEAARAEGPRTRVVRLRTGLVLARDGGALPKMLPPFWFGAGGPVGSGRQYWPWIHRQDWIDLVRFVIQTSAVSGPLNATAPNPATNAEFARLLGRALRRPALLPTPGFAMKVLLGEMAGALLLSGQRVVPAKVEAAGFRFTFGALEDALRAMFQKR